jgi:hypothetical protein
MAAVRDLQLNVSRSFFSSLVRMSLGRVDVRGMPPAYQETKCYDYVLMKRYTSVVSAK